MMALTPAERRGALVLVLLLGLGAARDLWLAGRPVPDPDRRVPSPSASALAGEDGAPAADAPRPAGIAESLAGAPDVSHFARPSAPLDLNRATVAELDALPGIGPVLARRIVEHRTRHGPFGRVEELLSVRGIGPRLFERLRPLVGVRRSG